MINNYNTNTENQKLDHKQALAHISTRLKEVLNPTQWIAEDYLQHRLYFKLSTDLTELSDLTISVNGITDNNKIILFTGYLSEENLSGINKGSQVIKCLGYYFENSVLLVIISIEDPDNTGETEKVRKLLIEIFTQSDTKNHCLEIVNLDEFPIVSDYTTVFDGSEEIDWEFRIKGNLSTDDPSVDPRIITIDPLFNSTITKIESAQTAEKLSNNITFNVSGEGVASSTATLDFDENPSEVNLTVDVSLPPASTHKIGGFRVWYDGDGCPQKSDNQCIVRIDDTGNYHFAYIDLNDINSGDEEQDIHRYSDMDIATIEHPNLGEIVQYIGDTNTNYIHGYFYMRVRELINGSLAVGTNWQFIDPVSGQTTLNTKLTEYNKVNDHIITISQPLVFTPIASTIVENIINDDTLFNIANGSFTDTITYAGIKEWGINLANLTYDSQHPELFVASLGLSYINESNPLIWVQKNVLPAIHMSSALVYKGVIEWDNLEDRTPISEPGDFYTVTDRSNQEYFFNGTITDNWEDSWEFMGKVVNVPTYSLGNGIDITASGNDNIISVKYDNSTIKKDNSGNLYVDGELTDTQADWNQLSSSAKDYIKNKPTGVSAFTNDSGYITSYTNTASLLVSDISNKKINTSETTGNYLQFTGGTDKFTITDKNNNSFDVPVTVTDNKQKITSSSSKFFITGVIPESGNIPSSSVEGVATSNLYFLENTLHLDRNIEHPFETETLTAEPQLSISINSSTKYKFIKANFTGDITLNIVGNAVEDSNTVREIIYRISNILAVSPESGDVYVKITSASGISVANMYTSSITSSPGLHIAPGETLELIFTFWGPRDVTFNGGKSI